MASPIVWGCLIAVLAGAPEERQWALDRARESHGRGDLKGAISKLEEALRRPELKEDPTLLDALASAYRAEGLLEKSEATSKLALARAKGDVEAHKNLALVYLAEERYRLAELVAARAAKRAPKDGGIENILGMIAYAQGEASRAQGHFRRAAELDPKLLEPHFNLGSVALEFRDYVNAERHFARAAAIDPKSPSVQLGWALAQSAQRPENPKKGIEAGQTFERVLSLRQNDPEAVCGAGWAFTAAPEGWERANRYLTQCRALEATSAQDRQRIDSKLASLSALKAQATNPATNAPSSEKSGAGVGAGGATGAQSQDSRGVTVPGRPLGDAGPVGVQSGGRP